MHTPFFEDIDIQCLFKIIKFFITAFNATYITSCNCNKTHVVTCNSSKHAKQRIVTTVKNAKTDLNVLKAQVSPGICLV